MRTDTRLVLAVFVAALLLRLTYLLEVASSPYFAAPVLDELYLDNAALQLAAGEQSEPRPYFRAPLYPMLLGRLYKISVTDRFFTVRLFQHVLGALTCVLIFILAKEMAGRQAGIAAAVLAVFYGPLIFYEGEILIVTLFVFLNAAALCLLTAGTSRDNLILLFFGGMALGLSAITRPNILLFVPGACLWAFVAGGRRTLVARAIRTALVAVPVIALVGAVTARNYLVAGDAVLVASQGGINFFHGNGPHGDGLPPAATKRFGRPGKYSDGVEVHANRVIRKVAARPVKASEVSRAWYGAAFSHMKRNPGAWLKLMFKKSVLFWNNHEIKNNKNYYFCQGYSRLLRILPLSYGVITALGLCGLVLVFTRKPAAAAVLVALYVLLFAGSVVMFFICARLRLPVVVGLIPLAGAGSVRIVEILKRGAKASIPCLAALCAFTFVDWYGIRSGDYSQELWTVGQIHFNSGDYEKAIAALENSIEHDPKFPGVYVTLGNCYLQLGRHDTARENYEVSIGLQPNNPRALNGIGICAEKTGAIDVALDLYAEAAALDPGYSKTRTNLGILLLKAGRRYEALKWLEESIRLDSGDPETYMGLALYAHLAGDKSGVRTNMAKAVRMGGAEYTRFFSEAIAECKAE